MSIERVCRVGGFIMLGVCAAGFMWLWISNPDNEVEANPPPELDLRDREVRIELLIQDYHYLDSIHGIVATTGQPGLRRARAAILSAIREEYAQPETQQAHASNPFRDSVGIAEGSTIDVTRPTCWCRWTMLASEPPKYRLDQKCEICRQKERAGAR